MKVEICTLYWENTPVEMINAHKKVTEHFDLPVNYYTQSIPHGLWMDAICEQSESDVIGFLDGDCVPLSRDAIFDAIKYVSSNDTFLGVAQASNHIHPKTHIYAAPAFFFVTKSCWKKVATSFAETTRSDVAEEFSYVAEEKGIRYRALYPTYFEGEPVEGVWPLSNYGYYGIGTVFGNSCYHLYQGRMGNNLEKFQTRCDQIVNNGFSTNGFYNALDDYKGRKVS